MARRRFQKGSVFLRGKREEVYVGRWWEDEIQPDGELERVYKSAVLGTKAELKTKKNAEQGFKKILDRVNAVDYRPQKFGKIGDFSEIWEKEVLVHQKPSSVKATQSHLRTYIRPWLGKVRMEEFTAQAQQIFITRLSQQVSRKTVLNVLSTLASMLRTAKQWNYNCPVLNLRELALPAREIKKPVRVYTRDEISRIIQKAEQPYKTMFAIAALTGLRVGEVVGLQKADLDLDKRTIQVQRSAWYGKVQTVKSEASRAPVAMPGALAALIEEYLSTWKPNPEGFLFVNRNGRPYAANKVVEYGLWPVLDKLKIPRGGMHAFRHAHASLLVDGGANPKVTQAQMRHSDPRITLDIYSHVVGNAQSDAVEKLGDILHPNSTQVGVNNAWIQ